MKKTLLLSAFLLAAIPACFATKPADGVYIVEIIGSPQTFELVIKGDQWIDESSEEEKVNTVVYDEASSTVVIPFLSELCDSFSYVIANGYVDLYFSGEVNIGFVESFSSSFAEMKGANSVSADAVAVLEKEFLKIFYKMPIIRLRQK